MLFDTHAHYDDARFDHDRDGLLASMPANGVGLILNPGCDLETSRKAPRLGHLAENMPLHTANSKQFCIEIIFLLLYEINSFLLFSSDLSPPIPIDATRIGTA